MRKRENRASLNLKLKLFKLIDKFSKDVSKIHDGEPLDGDQTKEISNMVLRELDINNGNVGKEDRMMCDRCNERIATYLVGRAGQVHDDKGWSALEPREMDEDYVCDGCI